MRSGRRFCSWSSRCRSGRRLTPWLTPVLASAFALAVLGCRDGAESPTAPVPAAPTPLIAAVTGTLSFRHLSAGSGPTCGVTTTDQAYCWGEGRLNPTPVGGGLRFLEVSAGVNDGGRASSPSCGITLEHRAYCWGRDLVPVEVPGGRRFRQLSVGRGYACGVTPLDIAFCWGDNGLGQLGTGGGSTPTPVRVAGGLRFRRVFTSATHTCGATLDNRAYCWGANVFGQLGDGTRVNRPRPVAVAGGLRFRQVKPGSGYDAGLNEPELDTAFSCGVTTDDRVYCWGGFGLLGSAVQSSATPLAVAGGRRYDFVHPGLFHACALNLFDAAFCWGSNEFGQLGTGSGNFSLTPARVAGGLRFESLTVATTGRHSCGVTASHQAYCWGSNNGGQLGDGTNVSRPTPVAVAGAT